MHESDKYFYDSDYQVIEPDEVGTVTPSNDDFDPTPETAPF